MPVPSAPGPGHIPAAVAPGSVSPIAAARVTPRSAQEPSTPAGGSPGPCARATAGADGSLTARGPA